MESENAKTKKYIHSCINFKKKEQTNELMIE